MRMRGILGGLAAIAALALVGCGAKTTKSPSKETKPDSGKETKPDSGKEAKPDSGAEATPADVKLYTMAKCVISGKPIATDPSVKLVSEGQEVKFCCGKCIPGFKKDPAKYLTLIAEGKTTKN